MKRNFFILIGILFCSVIVLQLNIRAKQSKFDDGNLYWIAINVSLDRQGDAHLIIKNDKTILIDAGLYEYAKDSLIPFLKKSKIRYIDEIYVSHPHSDHYGGVRAILEDSEFSVGIIKMNMPTEAQMKKEWWGGNFGDLVFIKKLAKEKDIKILDIKIGDKFVFDEKTFMEILYVYDGINTPVGKTDINDMSFISMLNDYKNKFLFTGDLNKKLGRYLAKNANNIEADILKVPHHGTEGLAPNSFFNKVNAKDFIVPTSKGIWHKDWERSKRVRDYVRDNNINAYVNGIHGHIEVISNRNGYKIITQN